MRNFSARKRHLDGQRTSDLEIELRVELAPRAVADPAANARTTPPLEMRGSLRPGGQLRTDPAHVRFGPRKRGSCRYALPVSLLSSSAAEVRVGELRGGARLHLELVEGGTFKVVLEATRAAIVEATLLFTSSAGGSLAIPVSARILEPTLFHARANSLHVEREPPPSGPIEMMPLVASSRAVQILRLPGRRAGGPRLGWVETTIEPPAAELVVKGGGGGDAAAAAGLTWKAPPSQQPRPKKGRVVKDPATGRIRSVPIRLRTLKMDADPTPRRPKPATPWWRRLLGR